MKLYELKQIIREEIEKELSSKPEGMKVEDLKLYRKYKHTITKKKFIYIGIDDEDGYWFIHKDEDHNISFSTLKRYGFNPDKIVKDLNLEIFIDKNGDKYIKDYAGETYSKEYVENYLKPL